MDFATIAQHRKGDDIAWAGVVEQIGDQVTEITHIHIKEIAVTPKILPSQITAFDIICIVFLLSAKQTWMVIYK